MTDHAFSKVDKATFYQFIARQPEGRFEYVRGRIMQQQQGGTFRHVRLADRFRDCFRRHLDPSLWAVTAASRGVETAETIRYADVIVERDGADPDSLATTVPHVLVEVLSKSSVDRDLDVKPVEYLGIETLEAYVVASQSEPGCFVWVRDAARRFPAEPVVVKGLEPSNDIPALGLTGALGEIYRGLF